MLMLHFKEFICSNEILQTRILTLLAKHLMTKKLHVTGKIFQQQQCSKLLLSVIVSEA